MSETLILWLFAGAFGLVGVLFTLYWRHELKCKGVGEDVAVIKQVVSDIRKEIGDHESGLRGSIHKLRGEISPYIIREQHRRGE